MPVLGDSQGSHRFGETNLELDLLSIPVPDAEEGLANLLCQELLRVFMVGVVRFDEFLRAVLM